MGCTFCIVATHPLCVNIEHLFLGTHQDNMRDMVAKKRAAVRRGEDNRRAKLTAREVWEIDNCVATHPSAILRMPMASQNRPLRIFTTNTVGDGLHEQSARLPRRG